MIRSRLLFHSAVALALLGVVSLTPATAQPQSGFPTLSPLQCATALSASGDMQGHVDARGGGQLVKLTDDLAIESLTGDAALAHLWNVMSRHPDAFTESQRAAQARGWKNTEVVYVERTVKVTTSQDLKSGDLITNVPASYTESNAQGEIILWSANTGTNNAWSGTIYEETYANGAASTWQGEIDDTQTSYPWLWYQETWSKSPIGKQPVTFHGPPRPRQLMNAVLAYDPGAGMGGYKLADFAGWANCWRAGVVGGCIAAGVACRLSGPAWPACFGAWCVGVEVGSAVSCAFFD